MKTIAAPTAIAAFQSRPDVQQVLPRLACSSSLRGRKANTRRTRQDDKPQSRETFAMQLQNKHSHRERGAFVASLSATYGGRRRDL